MSLRELFEDDKGRLSSTRLSMLYGVLIGGGVVVYLTIHDNLDWEIFATFLAATGGVYGWGKYRESVETMKENKDAGGS